MTAVPNDLKLRFEAWNERGRPAQPSFSWNTRSWLKHLGSYSNLTHVSNPVGRGEVTVVFSGVHSAASALDAYIASYVWGYAHSNVGPYRAARVIRANSAPESTRDFAADLYALAAVAQRDGGVAAFEWVSQNRMVHRGFFKHWGAAFGTKFISFATAATEKVPTAPILDAQTMAWFNTHAEADNPIDVDWLDVDSYKRYSDALAGWATQLDITPDLVEQIIFVQLNDD